MDGVLDFLHQVQSVSKVLMNICKASVKLKCLSIVFDCLLRTLKVVEGISKADIGLNVTRIID